MTADLPRMDEAQHRKAKKLIRGLCCNYDGGNCLALDDGEPCVCVQCISYSVVCRWFLAAVLPSDRELWADIMRGAAKWHCVICGKPIHRFSNAAKYCLDCAARERRRKDAARKRKSRLTVRKSGA